MANIIDNKFIPKKTKRVVIHGGRFHADDMMCAAIAIKAANVCGNEHLEIIRKNDLPATYDEYTIIADMGYGRYDHHIDFSDRISDGAKNNTEDHLAAACGLLYREVEDILFPGESESKLLFQALIDIIEHCDNTQDDNTFSDAIKFLTTEDESKNDVCAHQAIDFCYAVLSGFMNAHKKEQNKKIWASPKIISNMFPGAEENIERRYMTLQAQQKYNYKSFNQKKEIHLSSLMAYSLSMGALNNAQRKKWTEIIIKADKRQQAIIAKRLEKDWPKALAKMKNKTVILDAWIPYGQMVKQTTAVFIVSPSMRGGYNVNIIKKFNGEFRVNPDLLINSVDAAEIKFIPSDKRFISFETKESAVNAAYSVGKNIEEYLDKTGMEGYQNVYGSQEDGSVIQTLIDKDIVVNMFAKDHINTKNMTVYDYRTMQLAVCKDTQLQHIFSTHFIISEGTGNMIWDDTKSVVEYYQKTQPQNQLKSTNINNKHWMFGLEEYLNTTDGKKHALKVWPV